MEKHVVVCCAIVLLVVITPWGVNAEEEASETTSNPAAEVKSETQPTDVKTPATTPDDKTQTPAPNAVESPVSAFLPNGPVTLTGTFSWNGQKGETFPLKAVLTPAGNNEYKAVYSFQWNKKDQRWRGTVSGNLQDGRVTGTGDAAQGNRRFIFDSISKDGTLTGKTFETTNGMRANTGDMLLRIKPKG